MAQVLIKHILSSGKNSGHYV